MFHYSLIFTWLTQMRRYSIYLFLSILVWQSGLGQTIKEPELDLQMIYLKASQAYSDYSTGKELEALLRIDSLMERYSSKGNDVIWAYLFLYKGTILSHQGNYYLSNAYFRLSSDHARIFGHKDLLNSIQNSYLLLLVESLDTTGANRIKNQYLQKDTDIASSGLLFSIYINRAYSALYNGDISQATLELKKMSQIGKDHTESNPSWIYANRLLGVFYLKTGKRKESLSYLIKALRLSKTIHGEMHFQTGQSYLQLGDFYAYPGTTDSALICYEKAKAIFFKQNPNRADTSLLYSYESVFIECLVKLGKLQQHQPEILPSTLENFKLAIGRINQLSHSITSETSRFIIAEKGRYCFDAGIDCAIDLYEKTGEVPYLEQALAWSIEAKSLSLNQQFEKDQIYPVVGIPEELSANQLELRRSLDEYLGESFDEEVIAPFDSLITALLNYERNERLIQSYYDKIRQVRDQNQFSPQKLIKNLNDAIYLGFHELDSVIVVFTQEGTKLQYSCIIKDKRLLSDLAEFRTLISHTPINIYTLADVKQFSELGYSLYSKLIGPSISHFRGRHILIQSDGCLLGIPFEALLRETTDSDSFRDLPYLVKDFTIQYVSISMLTEHPNGFGKKDLLLITCRNSTGMSEADVEVSRLHDTYSKSSLGYIDDPGFKNNSLNLSNIRIHVASHAVVNSPDPIQSGLTCSPDEPPLLKFSDILQLNLKGSHVFINGCQSGNGPLNHGEGLMSLGLAFAMAGSGSVIQHLWTASDRSSMELAGLYYQKLHRFTDADALQMAKKKYLKTSNFGLDHPYYWSGLICFSGSREGSRLLAPYLVILALLGCGALIYRIARKRTR
jgi:CHAT domain-containing protein